MNAGNQLQQGNRIPPFRRMGGECSVVQTPLRPNAANPILVSSDGLGWSDMHAAITSERPHEALHRAVSGLWITMNLDPIDITRIVDDQEETMSLPPFHIAVLSPNKTVKVKLDSDASALHVLLSPEVLSEVADEFFGDDAMAVEFESPLDLQDSGMCWLLRSVKRELLEPTSNSALTMDYLSRALSADVMRKLGFKAEVPEVRADNRAILNAAQFESVSSFILENLSEPIQLNDLAALTGLGRTNFIQRFRHSAGCSPHEYVTELRVQKAREMLANPALTMSQIAYDCGFSDQTHFSRTFKRVCGVLPSGYRRALS